MCEAKIITFEDGANFLAASDVTPQDTTSFNVIRGFVIGLDSVPSIEGDYFAQVTDDPKLQPALLRLMRRNLPVVEQTPEELAAEGFSEEAIVAGIRAARPLSPVS